MHSFGFTIILLFFQDRIRPIFNNKDPDPTLENKCGSSPLLKCLKISLFMAKTQRIAKKKFLKTFCVFTWNHNNFPFFPDRIWPIFNNDDPDPTLENKCGSSPLLKWLKISLFMVKNQRIAMRIRILHSKKQMRIRITAKKWPRARLKSVILFKTRVN